MKYFFFIALISISINGFSQNLIGGSVEDIKNHMLPTPWVLSKESLNKGFKHYLMYTGKDYNYTQGYYFNENGICDEYRIVSKMVNIVKFLDNVNSTFIKTSKSTWKSSDNNIFVLLELDHEKDIFTLAFFTPSTE